MLFGLCAINLKDFVLTREKKSARLREMGLGQRRFERFTPPLPNADEDGLS